MCRLVLYSMCVYSHIETRKYLCSFIVTLLAPAIHRLLPEYRWVHVIFDRTPGSATVIVGTKLRNLTRRIEKERLWAITAAAVVASKTTQKGKKKESNVYAAIVKVKLYIARQGIIFRFIYVCSSSLRFIIILWDSCGLMGALVLYRKLIGRGSPPFQRSSC